MLTHVGIFLVALVALLLSARFFTQAAEELGNWLRLPAFVIGVFIVGIGTSLPELISGILSVQKGVSDILPGNVIGSNISNLLLITGLMAIIHRKPISLNTNYLYIDLHFLVGSFLYFGMIAYDGSIQFAEAFVGLVIFVIYAVYLIKGEDSSAADDAPRTRPALPWRSVGVLVLAGVGIYVGADWTIESLSGIALGFQLPASVVALTLLSLGTTLPELAVNISAIRAGKAEMALGNVLGSCIFNTLMVSSVASTLGNIAVPSSLLTFALPMMLASGVLFYLLTQDKRMSAWEGWLFVCLYGLFMLKTAGF
jgi:cation:H+ antiporter